MPNSTEAAQAVPQPDPLFPLGQLLATPGALRVLLALGVAPSTLIRRHVHGDFGNLDLHDQEQNRMAVAHGHRVFSAYELPRPSGSGTTQRIWVITEADRACTTLLLPEEY